MKFIKNFLKGICLGAGAILPGISSGVLCVIFGIYDKLIESILGIFRNFKKNFSFLFPIILGGIIGIFIFGNLLSTLFERFELQTKYAFIGLILGSIPILIKKINSENEFKFYYIIYAIAAFGMGLLVVFLEKYISSTSFVASTPINELYSCSSLSIPSIIFLFISGFFMSIGIVVPGISSTLILMCFGIYNLYLESISSMNLSILIPLGTGIIVGSILFLKIIKYLLSKYYIQTFYSIIGFTLGSILVIFVPITFDISGLIAILLFIICFYTAVFFEKLS